MEFFKSGKIVNVALSGAAILGLLALNYLLDENIENHRQILLDNLTWGLSNIDVENFDDSLLSAASPGNIDWTYDTTDFSMW